tara:strand:- start:2539 stop:3471 length:933 start_codon:yes stop_codon:yes gene_type:complete
VDVVEELNNKMIMKKYTTYAWAARGLKNRVFILYAGSTTKSAEQRTRVGYVFKKLNRHRVWPWGKNKDNLTEPRDFELIENIKGRDIRLVYDSPLKSSDVEAAGMLAKFNEQLAIQTCCAVADYLEKECGIRVACGNGVQSASGKYFPFYLQWIKLMMENDPSALGGPEIDNYSCYKYDKELFDDLVKVVKGWQEAGEKKYNDKNYMKRSEDSEMYEAWSTVSTYMPNYGEKNGEFFREIRLTEDKATGKAKLKMRNQLTAVREQIEKEVKQEWSADDYNRICKIVKKNFDGFCKSNPKIENPYEEKISL